MISRSFLARDGGSWGGTDPPTVAYSYARGRGAIHALKVLEHYRSVVQCDGYAAYRPTRILPTQPPCIGSLIETCKLHVIDPQVYFTDVLTRLVNLWPASRLGELMPWAWAVERANKLAA